MAHKEGLILATQHGTWVIEPTLIRKGRIVEFKSICRVELDIASRPATQEAPSMIDVPVEKEDTELRPVK